jgi:hypothetical protein
MASKIKVDNIENQCGGAVVTKCGATTTIAGTNVNATTVTATNVVGSTAVKSDNIQAADGGNIINQCGTTITLGASGDTINLAAGASQTGFGRTGTVDWDTTAKTASFTAVSGNGYFVNTTSGAITVTLPASPSAGDIVGFNDYARTFGTNNLTIGRNGSNIQGSALDGTVSTSGQSTMFVYVDATQGWVPTEDQVTSFFAAEYITATGGTITTSGNFKIHTFTSPGTFTVCSVGNPAGSDSVDYLVVAGGGGGGNNGGGGGAGGYRESSGAASGCYTTSPLGTGVSALSVSVTGYPITIGGGGSASTGYNGTVGTSGSNSIFSTITSTGGGRGAHFPISAAATGGSGGGGGCGSPIRCGATGNTPSVTPPQGNPGGNAVTSPDAYGAGGGATAAGANGTPSGPAGGAGGTTSISGSPTAYAGGGGGATFGTGGSGGTGGGGDGSAAEGTGTAGTANTGGGGGGAAGGAAGPSGAGGSGIVVIRYKFQ